MNSRNRTNGLSRTGALSAVALSIAVLIGGCSDGPDAASGQEQQQSDSPEEQVAALARELGITDPPPVEVVRLVKAEDRGPLVEACLTEAGYSSQAASEEGIPLEQIAAYELAQFQCLAAYPIDPKYTQPFTETQVAIQYEWTVEQVIPCLRARGIAVSDPPSREVFLANWGTDAYFPFAEIPVGSLSNDELEELNRECPQEAPSDMLFGSDGA